MKVGDLVMWIGKDSDHGMIGMITDIETPDGELVARTTYDVMWVDGTEGFEIYDAN
jgi:hypothetical protein